MPHTSKTNLLIQRHRMVCLLPSRLCLALVTVKEKTTGSKRPTLKIHDYRKQYLFFLIHSDKNSPQGVSKQCNWFQTMSPDSLLPGGTKTQPYLSYTFLPFDVKQLMIKNVCTLIYTSARPLFLLILLCLLQSTVCMPDISKGQNSEHQGLEEVNVYW